VVAWHGKMGRYLLRREYGWPCSLSGSAGGSTHARCICTESIQWSLYLPYDVARGVQCRTPKSNGSYLTVEISTFRAAIDPERGACIAEIWRMHACIFVLQVSRPAARGGVCTTPW
jgi:hypothetical protein